MNLESKKLQRTELDMNELGFRAKEETKIARLSRRKSDDREGRREAEDGFANLAFDSSLRARKGVREVTRATAESRRAAKSIIYIFFFVLGEWD